MDAILNDVASQRILSRARSLRYHLRRMALSSSGVWGGWCCVGRTCTVRTTWGNEYTSVSCPVHPEMVVVEVGKS